VELKHGHAFKRTLPPANTDFPVSATIPPKTSPFRPKPPPTLALAASATAADSANIVGYTKIPVGRISLLGPMFVDVNAGVPSLQLGAIIPNGKYDDGVDVVQFLNLDGSLDWSAVYYGEGYGWYSGDKNGWVNTHDIDIGTGFVANTRSSDVEYCIAGEVNTNAIDVLVAQGIAVIGNAMPVTITLDQIVPGGSYDDGIDVIQFLKPDGSLDWSAVYYGAGYGWYSGDKNGWVNSEELKPGEFIFALVKTAEGVMFSLPELVIED